MYRLVALAALVIVSSAPALSMSDTQVNRLAQAQRYAQLYDLKSMLIDLVTASPAGEQQRAEALQRISKLDAERLRAVLTAAMVQVFTADELAASADFYETPVGRSIMSKLTKFNLAITPGITEELERAFGQP